MHVINLIVIWFIVLPQIEDINRLQDELHATRKFADQTKIESADTINQLSKSLEASQRQLRDILEEGRNHARI